MTAATSPDQTLLRHLVAFSDDLRRGGVAVSMVETLDAAKALHTIDLATRTSVRAALAASLVKNHEDLEVFDRLFAVYFPPRPRTRGRRPEPPPDGQDAPPSRAADGTAIQRAFEATPRDANDQLLQTLLEALRSEGAEALDAAAELAVDLLAGIKHTDQAATERYYLYRVLRGVDLGHLMSEARKRAAAAGDHPDEAYHELSDRIEELRRAIADEVRRQLRDRHDRHGSALETDDLLDTQLLGASPRQLEELRSAVRPLARKLATRIAARRRRHSAGRLDVRRTMRHALETGGVPMVPAFRRPRVSKPELFLLADVSGSMAEFADFTLAFLHAVGEELSHLRSFAFVDGVDEITSLFRPGAPPPSIRILFARADVVARDGHSDYGAALRRFEARYGTELSARSTMLITGDARTNHRDTGVEVLADLRRRTRSVYWLNPEPEARWDTADSAVQAFTRHVDRMFEVRTVRQLEAAVERIF